MVEVVSIYGKQSSSHCRRFHLSNIGARGGEGRGRIRGQVYVYSLLNDTDAKQSVLTNTEQSDRGGLISITACDLLVEQPR